MKHCKNAKLARASVRLVIAGLALLAVLFVYANIVTITGG